MRIGIISGSGTYALAGFTDASTRRVTTAHGVVQLTEGRFAGGDVLHIARHGDGHLRLSNHIEHRANILAMRAAGAQAIIGLTVCGAVDPGLPLGSLVVFDDLHFPTNRLPDGGLCSLYGAGEPGRGHWIFERPFSEPLRAALVAGANAAGQIVRDGGCYGHVDGPRFNSRSEIRMLASCGVTAVSQTAGPEVVLAGEAGLPYALLGYATDYANGVQPEPTPVDDLVRLIGLSGGAFAATLASTVGLLPDEPPAAVGSHFRFD